MADLGIASWESELVQTGRIVQDGDTSVSQQEAERRFERYLALVGMVDGSGGLRAARALVRSIQVQHDYGAYQRTMNKLLFSFPADVTAEVLVAELPRLIADLPDWAGDLLSSITQASPMTESLVASFNTAVASAAPDVRRQVLEFIRQQEQGGWLEHRKGLLRA
jgi:hypothetical protein